MTGLFIGLLTAASIFLASVTFSSVIWSAIAFMSLALGYVIVYVRMVRHRW